MLLKRNDVETVVLLGRNNIKLKTSVKLDLDMEDYYRIKDAEKGQE